MALGRYAAVVLVLILFVLYLEAASALGETCLEPEVRECPQTNRTEHLTKVVPPPICSVVDDVGVGSYPFRRFDREQSNSRAAAVVDAVKHAWGSYVEYAWGRDELAPVSKAGVDTFNGLAITIIDSIDTLYMLGLEEEYQAAREYILYEFQPEEIGVIQVFEATIRVLGGLLSIYHLTGDDAFLDVAENVGLRLGSAFRSPSGLPFRYCALSSLTCALHPTQGFSTVLAEVGTLQLEFRALGYHARADEFQELAQRAEQVFDILREASGSVTPGLLPTKMSIRTGEFTTNQYTFGAPGDSYYEYIVKMWIQGGKQEDRYKALFLAWMKDLENVLVEVEPGMYFVQMRNGKQFHPKMDHFVCFIPGTIYIGIDAADSDEQRRLWKDIAGGITATCHKFYKKAKIGLSGEETRLANGVLRVSGGHHLRPEVLESIFFMWRWTRDLKYREWAWEIFLLIEQKCRVEGGYAPIENVMATKTRHIDVMHSFFIAETLKYLWLIFSDDGVLPLDKYVLNTEAHPLLVMPSVARQAAGSTHERWSDR